MNGDFRISTLWKKHPKHRYLLKAFGKAADYYMNNLWAEVALQCPSGRLVGWTEKDIAAAAFWTSKPEKFVAILMKCGEDLGKKGLLERDGNTYIMHDWEEHQPHVFNAPARIAKSQKAGRSSAQKRAQNAQLVVQPVVQPRVEPVVQPVVQPRVEPVVQLVVQPPSLPTLLSTLPSTSSDVDRLNKKSLKCEESLSSPKPPSLEGNGEREISPSVSGEMITLYETCFGMKPPLPLMQELARVETKYTKDTVRKALRLAKLNGGRSWQYVRKILESWEEPEMINAKQQISDAAQRAQQGNLTTQEWLNDVLRSAALRAGHRPREDQIAILSHNPFGKQALKEIQEYGT